jgi:WXG100 family type VII secretion target
MTPPLASYAADLRLADSVVATLGSIEDELDEVVRDLRWRVSKLHATWLGQSAAAHLEAHGRWADGYAEMQSALSVMRGVVRTARENYQAAAAENTRIWESVR